MVDYVPKHRLFGVSLLIWALQLLYVVMALGLLLVILKLLNHQPFHSQFRIVYVLIMLAINIMWRVVVKKKRPEWF